MKALQAVFVFLVFTGISFAQGTSVEGNKVTQQEVAPVWPGCENSENTKKCFNTQMNSYIKENFTYSQNDAGEWVRGKAKVSFTIDDSGNVTNVETEGPQPLVNRELEKVVKSFPEMQPGMRGETPVAINYQMSFNF